VGTAGFHRVCLSVLAGAALGLACSGAGAAEPPSEAAHTAPWFNPAWQWRQVVRVDNPAYLGRFPTGGAAIEVAGEAKPDLTDIRVVTADGRVRPHVVLSAEGGRVLLRFGLAAGRPPVYYIYYGNHDAPAPAEAGLPGGAGGIHLDMHQYNGTVRNPDEFRTAFEASSGGSVGSGARAQINDTANPFSADTTRCLAKYEGVLRAPRSGDYGLRVKATGFACLVLDGAPCITQTRALGNFTGEDSIFLEQGDHAIALYVFSRHPTSYIAQLQWRPPGAGDYADVPPSAFPSDVGFSVIARQQFEQPLNAYFTAGILGQARLVRTDMVLSSARFHSLAVSSLGEVASCTWDFGDGETSADLDPEHVYRKPGTYTVTLTARDTLGFENTYARTIALPADVQGKMELIFNEQEERKIIRGDAGAGPKTDATVPLRLGLKFLTERPADLTIEQRLHWRGQTVTVFSERLSDLMALRAELEQLAELREAIARLEQPAEQDRGAVSGPVSGPVETTGRVRIERGTAPSRHLDEAIRILEELCETMEGGASTPQWRLSKLKQATAEVKQLPTGEALTPSMAATGTAATGTAATGAEDASGTAEAVARLHDLAERIARTVKDRTESPLALNGFSVAPVAVRRVVKTAETRLERELVLETELPNLPGRFAVSSFVLHGQIEIARIDVRVLLDSDPFPELVAHDPNLVDADGSHVIVKTTGTAELERVPLGTLLAGSPRALRVAVVDNSLCPAGDGYDESKLFLGMLQSQLETKFPSRTVTVRRFAAEQDAPGYFPVKRMLEAGEAVERFQPHVIVVSLDEEDIVANTPTETTDTYLDLMINHFAARTRAKIVLVTPPPRIQAEAHSKVFALALGRLALERNVELADVYESANLYDGEWTDLYLDDAVPNERNVWMMYMNTTGQHLVADTILKAILRE
jgi:hypothetical protein